MTISWDELDSLVGRTTQGSVPPFCVNCGYNLTGAVSARCPECGHYFTGKEWRQKAQQILRVARDLEQANQWARRGVGIGLSGAGVVVVQLLMNASCATTLLMLPALSAGLATIFLGLGVLRVPPLPVWTGDGIAPPRNYPAAVVCIVLGVIVATSTVFAI